MKLIFTFSLLIITQLLFGQMPKDPESGKYQYSETIQISGTAQELYSILKEYAINNFGIESITNDDPESRKISGTMTFNTFSVLGAINNDPTGVRCYYSLKSKDSKIRFVFENFEYQITSWFKHEGAGKGQVKRTHNKMVIIIANLKQDITKKMNEDDW